jgi:hypothetical protein
VGRGVSVGVGLAVEVGVNVGKMGTGVAGTAAASWARLLTVKKTTPVKPIKPIQIKPTIATATIINSLFDCPLSDSMLIIHLPSTNGGHPIKAWISSAYFLAILCTATLYNNAIFYYGQVVLNF